MHKKIQSIHYSIQPTDPAAHIFTVQCTVAEPDKNGQQFWLPAWIPGSYMIRDFARNIVSLAVSKGDEKVEVHKLDKQTWQCAPCEGSITITYTVYAWDLSVRSAHLDTTHAFFNGTSTFLAITGREHDPVSIEIKLPDGESYRNWQVATTLQPVDAALFSAGLYAAKDYDELIDHPVEMGTFTIGEFNVHDIPHNIILTGRHNADMERLCKDVSDICHTHVALFGELPTMDRYMFLLMVVGDGYGGLEHRSSTALISSRKSLPGNNMITKTDDYITLLGLFSHEYFHTWNVKRIKPAEFIPYDLRNESYTEQLWAFEGITSYYDDLGLIRSGVIDEKKYLELLGKTITRVLRGSGRLKQTLTESSLDAWSKFYKQDENAPNAIVSYYAKGALFALCLDLKIRELSQHRASLDDLMRRLWVEHGKPMLGTNSQSIQNFAVDLCGNEIAEFFQQYLSTTEDLPLSALLETSMSLKLIKRLSNSLDDTGGKAATGNGTQQNRFNLGMKVAADPAGMKVLQVSDGGDIQHSGIAANDVIIAIDGLKASKDNFSVLLQSYNSGDKVNAHVFRRDELMKFVVTLTPSIEDAWYIECADNSLSNPVRNNWLNQVDSSAIKEASASTQ